MHLPCAMTAFVRACLTHSLKITYPLALQVCYGAATAGDVLLAAGAYHLAPRARFAAAAALIAVLPRAATLLSAELGELLLAMDAPFVALFWVSLATVSVAAALTMCLPPLDTALTRPHATGGYAEVAALLAPSQAANGAALAGAAPEADRTVQATAHACAMPALAEQFADAAASQVGSADKRATQLLAASPVCGSSARSSLEVEPALAQTRTHYPAHSATICHAR